MNFTELIAELVARGAQDDDTRNGRWINEAYQDILNERDWPFNETTATGTADAGTATISDIRKIKFVSDISGGKTPGVRLREITAEELSEVYYVDDFTLTGTPSYWYRVSNDIKAYPVGGTIYVRYFQRQADLTGTDDPVFAAAYHGIIVDRAMVKVYLDDDQFEAAATLSQAADQAVAKMAADYQVDRVEHTYIDVGEPYDG